MRPLEDARRDVLAAVPRLEAVSVPLGAAIGLALASDLRASEDVPPFANSAMDGYAVLADDVREVPATLSVTEDVPAGHVADGSVRPGTAIKIMTGAPVPAGADTVVKVEDTQPGAGTVTILVPTERGTAVRRAGSDVDAGDLVMTAGTRLTPARLGVLSSLGVAEPLVVRRPKVAVMSTGDEVRPTDETDLRPGTIRDANRPMLIGLLAELGAEVVDLGIIPDDAGTLRSAIQQAAATCDAVFTSGGVSMGEYDLVKQILSELGSIEFWKVAMKPAKPFAFGLIDGTPLFGLPGNPVSVMVAFEQLARPALLTMMGAGVVLRPRMGARLERPVHADPAKTVFLRARSRWAPGGWRAAPVSGQDSNMLSAAASADCFIVVPRGVSHVDAGDEVTVEMIRWPESRPFEEGVA